MPLPFSRSFYPQDLAQREGPQYSVSPRISSIHQSLNPANQGHSVGCSGGLNENGPHRFIFKCLVPSLSDPLGRIRRWKCDLVGGISLEMGFEVSKAHTKQSLSFSLPPAYRQGYKLLATAPVPWLPVFPP